MAACGGNQPAKEVRDWLGAEISKNPFLTRKNQALESANDQMEVLDYLEVRNLVIYKLFACSQALKSDIVDEVTQNVFLRLAEMKFLKKWNPGIGSLKTWLRGIIRNVVLETKRQSSAKQYDFFSLSALANLPVDPCLAIEIQENMHLIKSWMSCLTEQERCALSDEGCGVSASTKSKRRSRAISFLRQRALEHDRL